MATQAAKIDWNTLKGIKKEDFSKRFEAGEFDDLLVKDADFRSAVNTGALFETASPGAQPQPTPAATVPPAAVTPEAKPATPAETPPAPAVTDPLWKRRGFGSEEEFERSFDTLQSTLHSSTTLNAENATLLKQHEDEVKQRKALQEEVQKLRSAQPAEKLDLPAMPDLPPVPVDQDFTSADYMAKKAEYDRKKAEFDKKLYESINKLHERTVKAERELEEVKGKTNVIDEHTKKTAQERVQAKVDREINNLFSEVESFASRIPEFSMGLPFTKVNEAVLKQQNGLLTQEQLDAMVPKKDMETFKKLRDMSLRYREFDNQGGLMVDRPKKYESLDDLYLIDMRKTGRLNEILKLTETKAREEGRREVLEKIESVSKGPALMPSNGGTQEVVRTQSAESETKFLQECALLTDSKLEADTKRLHDYVSILEKRGLGKSIPEKWKKIIKPT